MKLSYRWLQEFVSTTTPPDVLGEKFRMTSSEVEGVTHYAGYDHIYTGFVEQVEKHPNAERLQVCSVRVGSSHKTIVTNAKNVAANHICIVALEGARVRMGEEDILITPTDLRGVVSEGMFCSLAELGLPNSGEGEGIWMSTDQTIPQGELVATALGLTDSILDLEITPNRPDLLSVIGLAREVGAFEHKKISIPSPEKLPLADKTSQAFHISIDDAKMCGRYTAVRLEGNLTTPSPWWLQRRLLVSGIRPISAIVDVTNYVLLEMGQPLHAFSVDGEKNISFHLRSAHNGEKITLLDGTERTLADGDIIIADKKNNPIDLAGIMGGEHSSIQPNTQSVLLESACFHGPQIRRTSRRLGVRTEASTRFEKGVDPERVLLALERAVELLRSITDARVVGAAYDTGMRTPKPQRIHVTYEGVQRVLGVHISAQECKSILQKLGFTIEDMNKSGFNVTAPSWRKDVTLAEDIIEELIRIWGYDRVPNTVISGTITPPQPNKHLSSLQTIRRTIASLGGYECISLPFVSTRQLQLCNIPEKECVALPNPLSSEHAYISPSHLIGFLANISGVNINQDELTLFEIGKTFHAPHKEVEKLSILLRSSQPVELLVQRAKLIAERIAPMSTWSYDNDQAQIMQGNTVLGTLSVIPADIIANHKIRRGKSLVYMEFNSTALTSANSVNRHYKPLPQFPSIERDLTLSVAEDTSILAVEACIEKSVRHDILSSKTITTIYRGKPLDANQKAITIHFTYNAGNRTLTDQEVSEAHNAIITNCRKTLNATIND